MVLIVPCLGAYFGLLLLPPPTFVGAAEIVGCIELVILHVLPRLVARKCNSRTQKHRQTAGREDARTPNLLWHNAHTVQCNA